MADLTPSTKCAITDSNWYNASVVSSLSTTLTFTIGSGTAYSAGFTAPNTTNKCVGVWIDFTGPGAGYSYTINLQENSADVSPACTVTFAEAVSLADGYPITYDLDPIEDKNEYRQYLLKLADEKKLKAFDELYPDVGGPRGL